MHCIARALHIHSAVVKISIARVGIR